MNMCSIQIIKENNIKHIYKSRFAPAVYDNAKTDCSRKTNKRPNL
jgi:hypothetical protein